MSNADEQENNGKYHQELITIVVLLVHARSNTVNEMKNDRLPHSHSISRFRFNMRKE